jgi:hypothetical protein
MAASLRADREYWGSESVKTAILNNILKTGHKSNDPGLLEIYTCLLKTLNTIAWF